MVAAAGFGLGVRTVEPAVLYVGAEDVDAVLAKYRGRDDPSGPLTLMVIPSEVAPELRPRPGVPVPPAVALIDLLRSPDARERHVATTVLEPVAASLHSPAES